ncbi:hypothetical protein BLL42_21420 [Pseudomonas frederiksbergensis]|uniref:Uncharacterized protein n=1 Tax=Pseudomonas frederiksbergensis TaxID=104087 RepID=A0A1J0EPT8_9PSED|nr:hypothetical protein [Pseudomonas frederiksbergensis]APC18157.1 hypothetical protein BLL42_21420 [Pseudomonas frederiksbergensis]
MANPVQKLTPASEDLVRLRDEIAMQALNAMIISGTWGSTSPNGTFTKHKNYRDHSEAAYQLADEMLAARERR